MKPYRIISCDGGGILGLLTVVLLQRMKSVCPDLLDKVDLFAGTSTGGIIALCLAKGLSLDTVRRLYENKGEGIFKRNWRHFLGLTASKYQNTNLKKYLHEYLAEHTLGDLNKKVLISTFDLDNEGNNGYRHWKPKFFSNMNPEDDDCKILAEKVALYTSAAPTYFPAVDGFCDGGVVANNPSMAAIAEALHAGVKLEQIRLLSVGTSGCKEWIANKDYSFGKLDVGVIVEILMNGVERVAAFQSSELLKDRYFRLNPVFPEKNPPKMDQPKRTPEIVELGENTDLAAVTEWLDKQWGD